MSRRASVIARAFRRVALPLAWYYAVTLALPLVNGAAKAGGVFVGHALVVLIVPLFLIVLFSAGGELMRFRFRAARPGTKDDGSMWHPGASRRECV